MTISAEVTRFLSDHGTAESWAGFVNGVGPAPTPANIAAAMSAKGYQVGEADVIAALAISKQSALNDQQLHGVVGGQGDELSRDSLVSAISVATESVNNKLAELKQGGENINIVQMFEMQMAMNRLSQLSEMSTSVVSASNSAMASMARNVKS